MSEKHKQNSPSPDRTDSLLRQVGHLEEKGADREKNLGRHITTLGDNVRRILRHKTSCRCGSLLIEEVRNLEYTHKRLMQEKAYLLQKKREVVSSILQRKRKNEVESSDMSAERTILSHLTKEKQSEPEEADNTEKTFSNKKPKANLE